MDEELKHPKKKRSKKDSDNGVPRGLEALAKFTSSDVIRQVKAGMSRIAPLEPEPEGEEFDIPTPTEEPPQQ